MIKNNDSNHNNQHASRPSRGRGVITNTFLLGLGAVFVLIPAPVMAAECTSGCDLVNGDVNGDGEVDQSDVSSLYHWMFGGGTAICEDSADVNDDGSIDLSDAYYLGYHVWSGGPAPVSLGVPGDVNDDGDIDVTDLVVFYDWYWKAEGDVCALNADVNEDGNIDVSDYINLWYIL